MEINNLLKQGENTLHVGRAFSTEEFETTVADTAIYGVKLTPHGPSRGNILFTYGLGGHIKDYMPVLAPLANLYEVAAWDYRGHGKSAGKFDAGKACYDLAEIRDHVFDEQPVHLMGHSIGCPIGLSLLPLHPSEKMVFFAPFQDTEHLSFITGSFIRYIGSRTPEQAERIEAGASRIFKALGLNHGGSTFRDLRDQYNSLAALNIRKIPPTTQPILNFSPNRDIVLGVWTSNHAQEYAEEVKVPYQHTPLVRRNLWDASPLVRGLNHCLNRNPLEFAPFFKEEKEKDRDTVFDTIDRFLSRTE